MSAYYFNAAQGRGGSIAVDMLTFLPFLAYLRTRVEELRQVGTFGTPFTCFTGTKVQILTLLRQLLAVGVLARLMLARYSVYLLYRYKGTHTDAAHRAPLGSRVSCWAAR